MQFTLTFTKYDGTPKTLPHSSKNVLLCPRDCSLQEQTYKVDVDAGWWEGAVLGAIYIQPGDLWAYLPKVKG